LHLRTIIVAEPELLNDSEQSEGAILQLHGAQPEEPSVGRRVQLPGRSAPGRGKQQLATASSLHLKFRSNATAEHMTATVSVHHRTSIHRPTLLNSLPSAVVKAFKFQFNHEHVRFPTK
jgi:hypothetical protein